MSRAAATVRELKVTGPHISVGILTADLGALNDELGVLESAGVRMAHVDVMDGHFCPSLTMGPPIIKAMRTSIMKDVHLMIEEPLNALDAYVASGAGIVTVHAESTRHPHRILQALRDAQNVNDPERGVIRGVALNPGTPVSVVEPLLDEVELVLLLAVNPGWSGQRFTPSTKGRLADVQEMIRGTEREILLGVDGGITLENVAEIAGIGPDIIVTGSAVFNGGDAAQNARGMLERTRASTIESHK